MHVKEDEAVVILESEGLVVAKALKTFLRVILSTPARVKAQPERYLECNSAAGPEKMPTWNGDLHSVGSLSISVSLGSGL